MKSRLSSFVVLLVGVGLFGQPPIVRAQPAAPSNHVLQLDGTGGYVELPPNIFNDLTQATVEAWVRWDDLSGTYKRVFDYGDARQDMSIMTFSFSSAILSFADCDGSTQEEHYVQTRNILRTNTWCHFAVVSGPGGMKFYFDGILVGTNAYTGSFAGLKNGKYFYLGQRVTAADPPTNFKGAMDEFQVWKVERTEAQIRLDFETRLTGNEPNLAGLWNFENVAGGVVKDQSPGHHDGKLIGNARVVPATIPSSGQLPRPQLAIVTGRVTNAAGQPVGNATLNFWHGNHTFTTDYADAKGCYFTVLGEIDTVDIEADSGDLGVWKTGIVCQPGRPTEVNLTLQNAVSIAGRVSAFDGSLIPGAVVQLKRAGTLDPEPGSLGNTGVEFAMLTTRDDTNTSQNFRFVNVRPGDYEVLLNLPDRRISWHHGEVLHVVQGRTLPVDFQVAPFRKGQWRRYSTANGLPGIHVYDIHFAPDGMLWLCTDQGVSRFDGVKFDNLSENEGLINNRVYCVWQQTNGPLWFGTEKGVSLYDPAGRRFQNFPSGTNGLTAGAVFGIAPTPDGQMWLRTREGLTRFDGQSFHERPGIPRISNNTVPSKTGALAVDLLGRVWTATEEDDVWRVDGTNLTQLTPRDGLAANSQDALYVAPDGALWFHDYDQNYSTNCVTRYDGKQFETFPLWVTGDDQNVTAIESAPGGVLWFGEYGNVTRFDPRSQSCVQFGGDPGAPTTGVWKIRTGPEGALWFATDGGLYRYEEGSVINYTKADGLPHRVDSSAISRDGTLWFDSAQYTAPATSLVRFMPQSTNQWEHPFVSVAEEELPGSFEAVTIAPDNKGGLWLGGYAYDNSSSSHLYYYNPDAKSPSEKPFRPATLHGDPILALLVGTQDTLWVGQFNSGLQRVPVASLWTTNATAQKIEGISNWVGHIYQSSDGAIWTSAGIYRNSTVVQGLSRIRGSKVENFSPESTGGGLPSDFVNCFQEGPDGSLYLGTDVGLVRFDGKRFTTLHGTSDRPEPTGNVGVCFRDSNGVLWFAADTGVYRYDGIAWSSLNDEDGLPSLNVNNILQDHQGDYWLSTDKGVTRYRAMRRQTPAPELIVRTDTERRDAERIPDVDSGRLIGFQFDAPDFVSHSYQRFYRCAIVPGRADKPPEKRDPAWREPTLATHYEWNPKTPGEYTFFVQSIDRDLNYSEPARASLRIVTPWFANAFVMVPAGGGLLGLFGWAFMARSMVIRRKREADQLRERLYDEEHAAREAAELAKSQMEAKNRQLEEARIAADAANKAKSSFLANMSHELRTPLNAIIGYSEMLEEEVEDLGQVGLKPDLEKIRAAGKHLLGLINDVLDLSKVEAGKMTLYLEEFDVATMVREVAETVQPLVQKNGNRLVAECAPEIGTMRADVTKVRQTLFNLLSNASKFTDKGEIRLAVGAMESPASIKFIITDTGIGMTPEQMDKLFQAFSQADTSTTRKYGGTGLGLAISKKFCQMMGGDITVQSEAGKGSAFTVVLPRTPQEPASGAQSSAKSGHEPIANGPCVLVIDDDDSARDLMQRSLAKDGFRVELAATGQSGLALARRLKPAVITLDVMMPQMDGWAVLSALKADAETADIPVIMLTMLDEKQMGFALGAADYFTKPIDFQRLHLVLEKYRKAAASLTVLIIEDDASTREMLRRTLEKEGWQVAEATNGRAGLAELAKQTPALILLDLMMPEMDGFEFMEELRHGSNPSRVPVIVITAKDLTDEDRRRLNGGVERIIQKGASTREQMLAEVRAILVCQNNKQA